MTTYELLQALARLRVETGSLACLGCGREHNCSTHGCAILRAAADLIERLTAESADLRKEIEWKDMVIALAQKKQAEAEAERDALLGELRKNGCTYCKYATVCVDELSVFGQEDCDRCGERETCVCLTCSGYGSETDKWEWRGLPETPGGGEKT